MKKEEKLAYYKAFAKIHSNVRKKGISYPYSKICANAILRRKIKKKEKLDDR